MLGRKDCKSLCCRRHHNNLRLARFGRPLRARALTNSPMLHLLLRWDFSPPTLAIVLLAAIIFARGAASPGANPEQVRPAPFYAGLALIYAALQTHWDYYAGHMFFVHRLQHLALHDIGPFLLANSRRNWVYALMNSSVVLLDRCDHQSCPSRSVPGLRHLRPIPSGIAAGRPAARRPHHLDSRQLARDPCGADCAPQGHASISCTGADAAPNPIAQCRPPRYALLG